MMDNMTTKTETVALVKVDYGFRDGWHVFTSNDVPGLYVTSEDPKTAFNDVAPSIETLARLNDGIECVVQPLLTYAEFMQAMKAPEPAPADAPAEIPHPAFLQGQDYMIRLRAA